MARGVTRQALIPALKSPTRVEIRITVTISPDLNSLSSSFPPTLRSPCLTSLPPAYRLSIDANIYALFIYCIINPGFDDDFLQKELFPRPHNIED